VAVLACHDSDANASVYNCVRLRVQTATTAVRGIRGDRVGNEMVCD